MRHDATRVAAALAAATLGAGLLLAQPASAGDGFSATGDMATARGDAMSVRLADGRILVAGGSQDGGPDGPLATAEIFDPAMGSFTATGSMAEFRSQAAATLLDDGSVLVVGGDTRGFGAPVATAETYHPPGRVFLPTGSMATGRSDFAAAKLADGRVLVAGGYNTAAGDELDSAEVYDPGSRKFTPTGAMNARRFGTTATLLPSGKVLVAGGFGPLRTALASAELYDPASGTFAPTGQMSTPRGAATAAALPDGRVLVAGGDTGSGANVTPTATAEIYDPNTGMFTPTGSMSGERAFATSTVLTTGEVLVAGSGGSAAAQTADVFDPSSGKFRSAGAMNAARASAVSAALPNGGALVAGGIGPAPGYTRFATADVYPAPSSTSPVAPAPSPSASTPTADPPGIDEEVEDSPTAAVTVSVRARSGQSKLRVRIAPDLGPRKQWKFSIKEKKKGRKWAAVKKKGRVAVYRTKGVRHTRTIDLPKGRYKVKAKSAFGYRGATSRVVKLRR